MCVVLFVFDGKIKPVTRIDETVAERNMNLVTTGQAAAILGSSRLGYSSVGTHRRVRLVDALRLKEGEKTAGKLTRDQVRSLWLHQPVARRLVTDPERTLRRARVNLRRLMAAHPRGIAARWLGEWARLLDGPVDELLEAMTSRSESGCELRQNSPFAGVLTQRERARILANLQGLAA
jgi:hypothetical protein